MQPAVVIVEWLDSLHKFGWQGSNPFSDLQELPIIRSIGFLMIDDECGVTLAQSWSDLDHAHTISIPRGCIQKIEELNFGEEECQQSAQKSVNNVLVGRCSRASLSAVQQSRSSTYLRG